MKKFLFATALICVFGSTKSQIYQTKTGKASFDAGTGLEEISATVKSVISGFEASSGKIQFKLTIKAFEFKNALMGEHFNENYMESEKYPDSKFIGTVTNMDNVNISKDGKYPVTVKGKLTIHGVEKEIEAKGNFNVIGKTIEASSEFIITLSDYKIDIPGVVKEKLSKTAKIKVNCNYTILK